MKYIYLLCSLFYMVNSVAQTANGTAVNSTNDEPLAFITIINKSTQEGVVANYSGAFSIKANLGKDTLEFSSNGFESLKLVAVENMEVKLSPTAIDINTVIITSNREQELREETPIGISSINTQTIEDNKPTTIDQVLNQTPGVNMVDLGNEQHTMSIRRPIDYGASYLYLEDGVPIRTSGVFNHNALLEINMANVSKIEIVRGPASSMYGSEAIGGAVNFISKKPTLNQTAGVSIQGNNIGYKRTDFYASNTIKKKFGYRLAGYYADQTNGIVEHSDFNKLALSLNMRYNISEKSELLWSNSYIDYYSDMSGSLDSTDFFDKEYASNQTFTHRKVEAYRSKLALNQYWNKKSKTTFTGFFRSNSIAQNPSYRVKDDYRPWTGTGDPNLAHGQENNNSFNSFGMIAQHKQKFKFLKSSLVAGASVDFSPNTYEAGYITIYKNDEGKYSSYESTDSLLADYQANILNSAVYAQYKFEPVKKLKVTAGVRYDNFNYAFDNNLGENAYTSVLDGSNVFSRVTPKIGATYQLKKYLGFYGNISEGYVPPQITTLYVGNDIPSLKPVYYDNYEVGSWFTLFKDKARLEWSFYRMEGLNEIISVLLDDGSTEQQNAGKTLHQGAEYSLKTTITKELSLRWSETVAIHKFTDYVVEDVDFSGNEMPQSPRRIMNAQLTYKPVKLPGFRWSMEWQHIDKYFMESANTKVYDGHDIFNLRMGYNVKSWEFWTNIMNLFNESYSTVARSSRWGDSYSLGRPTNINFGVGYKFAKK